MNQNVSIQFNELSEEAAIIADASLIVRARFVEAADTMLHIGGRSVWPAAVRSFWPEIQPEPMDRIDIVIRYRPSAAAISRAEEVLYGWMLKMVSDDERRTILGRWSMCLAAPHVVGSWRQYCQKTNRIRRTAERHIQCEFQSISSGLIKNAKFLHEPDWSRVSPMMPNSATDFDKVRTPVAKHSLHMIEDGAKPRHDPNSPALAALIKRIEKANRKRDARRRKAA